MIRLRKGVLIKRGEEEDMNRVRREIDVHRADQGQGGRGFLYLAPPSVSPSPHNLRQTTQTTPDGSTVIDPHCFSGSHETHPPVHGSHLIPIHPPPLQLTQAVRASHRLYVDSERLNVVYRNHYPHNMGGSWAGLWSKMIHDGQRGLSRSMLSLWSNVHVGLVKQYKKSRNTWAVGLWQGRRELGRKRIGERIIGWVEEGTRKVWGHNE